MSREFYTWKVTTESQHTCVIDREYPGGIMACGGCGQFWVHAPREFLRVAFIAPALLERLREYQWDIRYGEFDSLAAAAAAASARDREARAKAMAKARADWPRRQAAKRAKWWRYVRPIILSRPCAYCGGTATAVDHIVPTSRGGALADMRNLAPSCMRCNTEKGKRTPEEWKAWRLNLGRPWPPPAHEEAA